MEQTAAIAPGRITLLGAAVPAGTTIYNPDSKAGIWVSATPAPGPGSGFRIGPQGSVEWTTAGPAYAALEAGETRQLSLTLTDNVGSPVDPVSVGAAVAAQLLNSGVPSVLVGEAVTNNTNSADPYDVGRFASLTVTVTTFGPTAIKYEYQQPNPYGAYPYSLGGRTIFIADAGTITFTTAVIGPSFKISDTAGQISEVTIYGSNRAAGERVMSPSATYGDASTGQIAMTSGQQIRYTPRITTNGGPAWIRMNISGTGKGYLCLATTDDAGARKLSIVLDSGNSHAAPVTGVEVNQQIILPPGRIEFVWLSQIAATYAAVLTVIPTS